VFMFSAPDSNSHIEMISQLAEVLSDDDMMEKVFAVQSTDELQALLLSKK
ncbi:PTS sugar transporter subunit IIA, partial [Klebsiella pneumoniae]